MATIASANAQRLARFYREQLNELRVFGHIEVRPVELVELCRTLEDVAEEVDQLQAHLLRRPEATT